MPSAVPLVAGSAAIVAATDPPADTVLSNGYVVTLDARDSVAQAMANRGGRIAYVGKLADLIVTDRNVMTVPAPDIARTRMLHTLVGGNPVRRRRRFCNHGPACV